MPVAQGRGYIMPQLIPGDRLVPVAQGRGYITPVLSRACHGPPSRYLSVIEVDHCMSFPFSSLFVLSDK